MGPTHVMVLGLVVGYLCPNFVTWGRSCASLYLEVPICYGVEHVKAFTDWVFKRALNLTS